MRLLDGDPTYDVHGRHTLALWPRTVIRELDGDGPLACDFCPICGLSHLK